MKVDIWSDIRCPFCYIGKRKFETALSHFEHKDQLEVPSAGCNRCQWRPL